MALIARNTDKLKILVSNLEKEGITAKYFTADVLDFKALEKALQDTKIHFGSIDVMEFSPTPPKDSMKQPRDITVTNEQFHLDLQLLAPIAAVQAVLPDMLAKKKGSLLFTTAASAQYPAAITGSFGVAAGGLLNYVRLLHNDLANENIKVAIVSVAGLIKSQDGNSQNFPPGIPVLEAGEVAELHWQAHLGNSAVEVYAGDIAALLKVPFLYQK